MSILRLCASGCINGLPLKHDGYLVKLSCFGAAMSRGNEYIEIKKANVGLHFRAVPMIETK